MVDTYQSTCLCCGETKYFALRPREDTAFICYKCTLDLYKHLHDSMYIDKTHTDEE